MADSFIVVDTDFLIDISRGISQAVDKLEDLEQTNKLSVSVITQRELMVGCENKEEFKELDTFLGRFTIFHTSGAISSKAVDLFEQYRLSHGVKIADMLNASTALLYDVELMTKNQKDFKFINGLKLAEYTVQ
jgi:predicted nucleic acid-binding protein